MSYRIEARELFLVRTPSKGEGACGLGHPGFHEESEQFCLTEASEAPIGTHVTLYHNQQSALAALRKHGMEDIARVVSDGRTYPPTVGGES